jgi:hypothetical protein
MHSIVFLRLDCFFNFCGMKVKKINFSKNQKLPEGYVVEWWECDEHYHWVIYKNNYSCSYSNRFLARRCAWIHSKK